MSNGPWPKPFVGTHIRLYDDGAKGNESWDCIPYQWQSIRFDAMDVLFISPFYVEDKTHKFIMGADERGTWLKRFEWVVRSARSKNPNVKIILVQMMGTTLGGGDFDEKLPDNQQHIKEYAASVAQYLQFWYNRDLPSLDGKSKVKARLNGYEVDVEGGTMVPWLPKIVAAVRRSLNDLSHQLQAPKFTVSICPAWTDYLDATMAESVDYFNMQRYSGGNDTTIEKYKGIAGLQKSVFVWGLCSEEPYANAREALDFDGMKHLVETVASGQQPGIWTWKVNSDNFLWANDFQVWLYSHIHGITLPCTKSEDLVKQYYARGGRLSLEK